jgi:hypothetical protein
MKWVLMGLFFLPLATFAQLPLPISPDFLKGGDKQSGVLHSTQVGLDGNNYRIIQTNVTAVSKGFKILGLITIKSPSYVKAMSHLYTQTQIQEGRPQALANVVHETAGMNLILFSMPKIRVRADLIEFIGPVSTNVWAALPPLERATETVVTTTPASVDHSSTNATTDATRARLRERLDETDR